MKRTLSLILASAMLTCLTTAFGCGTAVETTKETTKSQTTETTGIPATTKNTEKSTQAPETSTTESAPETMTEPIMDPDLPLPDIDNPITNVEPNIPESGVDNDGALGDIFEDGGMNGDTNGINESNTPDIATSDAYSIPDARGRNRRNIDISDPMRPSK
jgi:hypothetical protein